MTQRFPEVVLAGDGFVLRPLAQFDVADVTAACNDATTLEWLPLPRPYEREHAEGFIDVIARDARESGRGVVFAIDVSGRLHGCIDLKATDWRAGTTEVGYWVAPWGRGRRLAGRATRLLAEWALRDHRLERVVLHAATGNLASQRSAESAGFVREGVARNAGLVHGGRVDLVVYSLVRDDLQWSVCRSPGRAGT